MSLDSANMLRSNLGSSPPVCVFAYNRPDHLEHTLTALSGNVGIEEAEVLIFCDGSKGGGDDFLVERTRAVAQSAGGFTSRVVVRRERNLGLAASIKLGVSSTLERYGKAVVLEDDLETSPFFYSYMRSALAKYEDYEDVLSVSGYSNPYLESLRPKTDDSDVVFLRRHSPWGWGTWESAWAKCQWDPALISKAMRHSSTLRELREHGENQIQLMRLQLSGLVDSWSVFWAFSHVLNGCYSVTPVRPYVRNFGFDGSGVHCARTDRFDVDVSKALRNPVFPDAIVEKDWAIESLKKAYGVGFLSKIKWGFRRAAKLVR